MKLFRFKAMYTPNVKYLVTEKCRFILGGSDTNDVFNGELIASLLKKERLELNNQWP